MKTALIVLVPFAVSMAACSAERTQASGPVTPSGQTTVTGGPLCVVGGLEPASEGFEDYGTTYTPDVDGPAPAVPGKRVEPCSKVVGQKQ